MSTSARRVLVDDTDPGITYTGSWFADRGSQDTIGNSGFPYLHTLHGTISNSSFSYTFQGTSIRIHGTQQYASADGTSAVTNPSWDCFVDGRGVGASNTNNSTSAQNNLLLCAENHLSDGPHTVNVNVHVEDNRTFWLDTISYEPSASVSLENAAIAFDIPAPGMNLVGQWSRNFTSGWRTSTQGSNATFDFNGIFLTWYGFYYPDLPVVATTAIYSVDGGESTIFNLNGAGGTNTDGQYNQIFFQTPTLPAGLHTVVVTYQGITNATTPLSVQSVVVQNGTSSTTNAHSTPHSTSHTGPIVGGVVGALAIVIAAIILFLFLRRKKNHSQQTVTDEVIGEINPRTILPYSLNGNTLSTFENSSPSHGNPVVGKRNVAAMEASAAGQQANTPSISTDNSLNPHPPTTTTTSSIPVKNVPGMHAHTPSLTSNTSVGLTSSTGATSATRSEPFGGSNATLLLSSAEILEVSRPWITRDEDSGIRIRQTDEGDVVVLPPAYTAS